MDSPKYRFQFTRAVEMAGVEETLLLSVIAAEGIYGRARVRLDGEFATNPAERTCSVAAGNEVGPNIAKIFTEFLVLEVGEAAFDVDGDHQLSRYPM